MWKIEENNLSNNLKNDRCQQSPLIPLYNDEIYQFVEFDQVLWDKINQDQKCNLKANSIFIRKVRNIKWKRKEMMIILWWFYIYKI